MCRHFFFIPGSSRSHQNGKTRSRSHQIGGCSAVLVKIFSNKLFLSILTILLSLLLPKDLLLLYLWQFEILIWKLHTCVLRKRIPPASKELTSTPGIANKSSPPGSWLGQTLIQDYFILIGCKCFVFHEICSWNIWFPFSPLHFTLFIIKQEIIVLFLKGCFFKNGCLSVKKLVVLVFVILKKIPTIH